MEGCQNLSFEFLFKDTYYELYNLLYTGSIVIFDSMQKDSFLKADYQLGGVS